MNSVHAIFCAMATGASPGGKNKKISRFSTNFSLYLRNDTRYGHSYKNAKRKSYVIYRTVTLPDMTCPWMTFECHFTNVSLFLGNGAMWLMHIGVNSYLASIGSSPTFQYLKARLLLSPSPTFQKCLEEICNTYKKWTEEKHIRVVLTCIMLTASKTI